jgi:putative transposase
MRRYLRARVPGGVYFFTVVLESRRNNDLLIRHIEHLRDAFRRTRRDWPFIIEAICVLPEHLHCIWRLPEGDADFPTRWSLIKQRFSRQIPAGEAIATSRQRKGERGIWQRRYWEHVIRDERDYRQHMDYIHYNPVRHGLVERPLDWPYSSLPKMVAAGLYPADWSLAPELTVPGD